MALRVKSSDVLDTTHLVARPIPARVVGYFRRTGPNSWDDYVYVDEPGEALEVLPGVPVQLEARGPDVRLRRQGRVVRVHFEPDASSMAKLADDPSPRRIRRYFVETFLTAHTEDAGLGATAVVVKKLSE